MSKELSAAQKMIGDIAPKLADHRQRALRRRLGTLGTFKA
jgi:hypothetical protein